MVRRCAVLLLQNLWVLGQDVSGPVRFSSIDLSADGRWLGYGIARRTQPAPDLIHVRDMRTGTTRGIADSRARAANVPGPRWSPDGKWLAFVVVADGKNRLAFWQREHNRVTLGGLDRGLCRLFVLDPGQHRRVRVESGA